MYLDSISPDAEFVTVKADIVTLILNIDKSAAHFISVALLPYSQRYHHTRVINGITQGIYAGYTGNDYNISAFKEAGGSRVTQTLKLAVDV